jgi:hypothetical protein
MYSTRYRERAKVASVTVEPPSLSPLRSVQTTAQNTPINLYKNRTPPNRNSPLRYATPKYKQGKENCAQLAQTPPHNASAKPITQTPLRKILQYSPTGSAHKASPTLRREIKNSLAFLNSLTPNKQISPKFKNPPMHMLSPRQRSPIYKEGPKNGNSPRQKLSPVHQTLIDQYISPMLKRNPRNAPRQPFETSPVQNLRNAAYAQYTIEPQPPRISPLKKQSPTTIVSPVRSKTFQKQGGWIKNPTQLNINVSIPGRESKTCTE